MKLFADTANHGEIDYCFSRGINDGITTNPKIMENAGVRNFQEACKGLVQKYSGVPISLETDLHGIPVNEIEARYSEVCDTLVAQAREISGYGPNVVVKIPICRGGLEAVSLLSKEGIKTNVTACMNAFQALEAERAGATYVSLFSNRIVDAHILQFSGYALDSILSTPSWKEIVKQNRERYLELAWEAALREISHVAETVTSAELIVGSIRQPRDLQRIASARPQIITIPYEIVKSFNDEIHSDSIRSIEKNFQGPPFSYSLRNPMTDFTLTEFEKSAETYKPKKTLEQ